MASRPADDRRLNTNSANGCRFSTPICWSLFQAQACRGNGAGESTRNVITQRVIGTLARESGKRVFSRCHATENC
jgi:hypothetical protein